MTGWNCFSVIPVIAAILTYIKRDILFGKQEVIAY